jgi:hypothetical protein
MIAQIWISVVDALGREINRTLKRSYRGSDNHRNEPCRSICLRNSGRNLKRTWSFYVLLVSMSAANAAPAHERHAILRVQTPPSGP